MVSEGKQKNQMNIEATLLPGFHLAIHLGSMDAEKTPNLYPSAFDGKYQRYWRYRAKSFLILYFSDLQYARYTMPENGGLKVMHQYLSFCSSENIYIFEESIDFCNRS